MADIDEASGSADVDVQVEVNPIAHLIAPLAAIGATIIVRKMMDSGYKKVTGGPVPAPRDPRVTFGRALMWAAVTAATTDSWLVRSTPKAAALPPLARISMTTASAASWSRAGTKAGTATGSATATSSALPRRPLIST